MARIVKTTELKLNYLYHAVHELVESFDIVYPYYCRDLPEEDLDEVKAKLKEIDGGVYHHENKIVVFK